MIEKVEVACTLVVHKYFFPLADIQLLVVVNSVHVALKQCLESLGSQIELCHTVSTEQIYFSVFVSGDAQYSIAEQTIRIVFIKFETFDIVTVIPVKSFTRADPYNSSFVNIKAINRELGKPVVRGQMAKSDVLTLCADCDYA